MAIQAHEFQIVADMVYHESGITLEVARAYLVEARLTQLAREQHLKSYSEVIEKLNSALAKFWIKKVVEALTVHETFFFRDTAFYDALKNTVIPTLIKRRASEKSLSMWCAASSTGQEPYSINMLLREHFPELRGWKIRFLVSDVSERVLKIAQAGLYNPLEINRGLPEVLRDRYFKAQDDRWIVNPVLKEGMEFQQINLKQPLTSIPQIDLCFMRNVLIYFDDAMKNEVLAKVASVIRDDGLLFLCTSELLSAKCQLFQRARTLQTSAYRHKNDLQIW